MSVDATRWAWMQAVTPTQKLLLLSLADRAGEGHECWPSIKRLEVDTGLYRETIYQAIQDLEAKGLLEATRKKGQGNRYRLLGVPERHQSVNADYTSREKPTTTSRQMPTLNLPLEPNIEPTTNSCTNNTQSKSTLSGTNNTPRARAREVSFNPLSISLPDWLTPECWSEWVAHRASLKKPVKTQSTAMAILKTLDKLRDEGSPPEDVVLQSIANGWQGLFPVKQTSKGSSNDNRKFSKLTEHHFAMSRYQQECLARALAEEELDRGVVGATSNNIRLSMVKTVGNA